MKLSNKNDFQILLNKLGETRTPFFALVDYGLKNFIIEEDPLNNFNILFSFNGIKNFQSEYQKQKNHNSLKIDFEPIDINDYKKSFDQVITEINRGNTYLCNLTFPVKLHSINSLEEMFLSANAKYKILADNFLVFSPETFIQINENIISTFPMKGTKTCLGDNDTEELLNNQKELDEHSTIVDLLRNDLSIVAKDIKVENFRYLDEIVDTNEKKHLQVSSKISGTLENNFLEKLGDIILALLPAGSITGAPKHRTIEIIKNVENYNRGFYTGVGIYFDGASLDSCVLIRFIENLNNQLIFKTGGGITNQSTLVDEYNELLGKIYVPIS